MAHGGLDRYPKNMTAQKQSSQFNYPLRLKFGEYYCFM
jgi:hypothetical protein